MNKKNFIKPTLFKKQSKTKISRILTLCFVEHNIALSWSGNLSILNLLRVGITYPNFTDI